MSLIRLDEFSDYEGYGERPSFDFADEINRAGVEGFVACYGTLTPETAQQLADWLNERVVPMTTKNLIVAYREIFGRDVLPPSPPAPQPEIDQATPLITSVGGAPRARRSVRLSLKLQTTCCSQISRGSNGSRD